MATDDTHTKPTEAYEVIAAQPEVPKTLEVDGKRYDFRDSGMMRIADRGLAMAIRDKYGKGSAPGVTVTKVNHPAPADRGHRYFFSVPELPWRKNAVSND